MITIKYTMMFFVGKIAQPSLILIYIHLKCEQTSPKTQSVVVNFQLHLSDTVQEKLKSSAFKTENIKL